MMWEAVESIEIVEADEDVISLIQSTWQKYPWHSMAQCTIIHMKIEDYLQTTSSKYDTVYIDTWDAIYQEYPPHLNRLADPGPDHAQSRWRGVVVGLRSHGPPVHEGSRSCSGAA